MSLRTQRQRDALRQYQQARDIEDGLLARNGISLWRVAMGTVLAVVIVGLFLTLAFLLGRTFP